MKLQNFGEELEMIYDSRDVNVPSGVFEVSNKDLGYFIRTTASKWGKDVKIIDDKDSSDIKKDVIVELKKEDFPDAQKESVKEPMKDKKASK